MAPPHLLIVDDDAGIRDLLQGYLHAQGYGATAVADGEGMWKALREGTFDLVVLDLMLPGDDGITLCRALRESSALPIIMLTAHWQPAERVAGLDAGADDYVMKPFDPVELLARVRAVLRRTGPAQPREPRALHFNGWRLDTRAREITSPAGRVVSLGGSDYRALRVLLASPHAPVGRDQLVDQVYGRDRAPNDRAIDVCVSRLRQYLEDDARNPSLIRTLRNQGYVLTADVHVEH
jgi:two-component system, OmpR family, response regulator